MRPILALALCSLALPTLSAAQDAPPALAPASVAPELIILNLTARPATEMAVTWRSTPRSAGVVQFARATAGPDFVKAPQQIAAFHTAIFSSS